MPAASKLSPALSVCFANSRMFESIIRKHTHLQVIDECDQACVDVLVLGSAEITAMQHDTNPLDRSQSAVTLLVLDNRGPEKLPMRSSSYIDIYNAMKSPSCFMVSISDVGDMRPVSLLIAYLATHDVTSLARNHSLLFLEGCLNNDERVSREDKIAALTRLSSADMETFALHLVRAAQRNEMVHSSHMRNESQLSLVEWMQAFGIVSSRPENAEWDPLCTDLWRFVAEKRCCELNVAKQWPLEGDIMETVYLPTPCFDDCLARIDKALDAFDSELPSLARVVGTLQELKAAVEHAQTEANTKCNRTFEREMQKFSESLSARCASITPEITWDAKDSMFPSAEMMSDMTKKCVEHARRGYMNSRRKWWSTCREMNELYTALIAVRESLYFVLPVEGTYDETFYSNVLNAASVFALMDSLYVDQDDQDE